jgi:microsomal dipeptidase-like Zn-dependent dipeptidase
MSYMLLAFVRLAPSATGLMPLAKPCPLSPDNGPGLTDLGKELVRRRNKLRILIDLSHINERGFWGVAEISEAPLVAFQRPRLEPAFAKPDRRAVGGYP